MAVGKHVAINICMNNLVVYPGRFHPFHLGHKASYDWLTNRFGENSVYIATSDPASRDPAKSPFDYPDKVKMMTKLGVPASHVVKVKNPYQAKEIVDQLSAEEKKTTALIFAVSAKDAERFSFKPKKDGSPSYLQPLPDKNTALKPMSQVGYVAITPTVNFRVKGANANSASEIRDRYLKGNDVDRKNIITDLYGEPDAELKAIFDKKLGANQPDTVVDYGNPVVNGGDTPVSVMRESRVNREKIKKLQEKISLLKRQQLDYIDEKNHR